MVKLLQVSGCTHYIGCLSEASLKKQVVAYLIKKFLTFVGTIISLLCAQTFATGHYPETSVPSLHSYARILEH